MKQKLKRCESLLWLGIKLLLYLLLLFVFVRVMAMDSISLSRLSRTLGITVSTFCIVGLLFLRTYGQYDVGRRKSKPIIYSLSLAVLFTDLVTYLQIMIMRTNTPNIRAFRLNSLPLLLLAFVIQILIIVVFTYGGNGLFFIIHPPEKCCIVTSSQRSLDQITRVITKFRRQYKIDRIFDYRKKNLLQEIGDMDTVFIYDVPMKYRSEIVDYCYKKRINIYFNPEVIDVVEKSAKYYVLDDVTLLNANKKSMTMEQRIMKRLLDIGLAVVMGVLSSPLWILSAVAIKLQDGGSVIFKQKRATINGKVFEVYKFRTMKENVSNYSATKDDDRITTVGRFLRKTRIDEIPQLWNVLIGDMTFVGPRPEMLKNVNEYTNDLPEFQYRLRVKAGLTGYAQVRGKYNTTPRDKLIMDLMYIENFSILDDIKIIFQTFIVLLKSDSTEEFQNKKRSVYKFEREEKKH
jgi:exopolysaccharide biosynthesis polyprenyl glycosylphosphotransferase